MSRQFHITASGNPDSGVAADAATAVDAALSDVEGMGVNGLFDSVNLVLFYVQVGDSGSLVSFAEEVCAELVVNGYITTGFDFRNQI